MKARAPSRRSPSPSRELRVPVRMLIVEDHPIVRRGLRDILAEEFPGATFGEAGDSRAATEALRRETWDVMLLDINIPGRGGLELLEELGRSHPAPRVLVVSAYPEEEFAVRAFKLGAAGYLGKNRAPDELVEAVRKILAGGKYVTASLAERLASALSAADPAKAPHELLSNRELQVLRLVAAGRTVRAIAAELALSEKTIATYRARISDKTGLASNVELTRYAFRHGLAQ